MLVINTIKDLLSLAASIYINPLNIKIPVINIVKDLLLLVANIYIDLLVPI